MRARSLSRALSLQAVMSGLCIQSISLDLVLSTLGTAALAASRLGARTHARTLGLRAPFPCS
jgi:hypothetical protein